MVSGRLVVPAVPALADDQAAMCAGVFAAVGRAFSAEELQALRVAIRSQADVAFAASARSHLLITYEATASSEVSYLVEAVPSTLEDAYASWIGTREGPLFGPAPDARVTALVDELEGSRSLRVLDIGAGTGRNAVPLARRGHLVDAVELTPAFVEVLRSLVEAEPIAVRVIEGDLGAVADDLRLDYDLIVASELVTDLRSAGQLRALFDLAAGRLAPGGRFVLNAFRAEPGYVPDDAVRELGQQLYTAVFTSEELAAAAHGLPLELVADDPALSYEQAHLPADSWPPTPWYVDWARGLDLFDLAPDDSPIELRWLVYERTLS